MLRIKDRVELQLIFNGKEFPFDRVNSLDFLHMSCSTRLSIPMIHVRVKDAAEWFSKNQDLVDGAPIVVTIIVQGQSRTFRFRLNKFKELLSGDGVTYDIDGYYNAPGYWLASTSEGFTGSSDTVLKEIATRTGIGEYVGTPTADSQLWQTTNKKYHEFARHIAGHGYVNDTSCMQLAYDLSNTLIYKNVGERTASTSTFLASKYKQNTYTATDFRVTSNSGIYNAVSGYAEEVRFTDPVKGVQGLLDKVQSNKLSMKMMMNDAIYKGVDQARVRFRPIGAGNVNESYEKAEYQNRRLANLFSFGAEIVTPDVTTTKLLDFIEYEVAVPENGTVNAYSGTYLVTSRAIMIQGINYFEKFEVVRQGLNGTANTQVG